MSESERLDKVLDALHLLVDQLSATKKTAEMDPSRRFYHAFNQEADEYDKDFHSKYHDDLNTTLIFAGLFSAVASAFIVDVQNELRPDYQELSFTVLTMLLNATSGTPNQHTIANYTIPKFTGPNSSAVEVQSVLFGSLASSLFAAFFAMLGKQWLNLHVEGSFIDRSRHRELRMRGMITWRFKIIIECLPFVLQISLFLLGYALSRYVWGLSKAVGAVLIAFTSFGVLFYLFIVVAGTRWKTCPFQTPVSFLLRFAWSAFRQHREKWFAIGSKPWSGSVLYGWSNASYATAPEFQLGFPQPHLSRVDLTSSATLPEFGDGEDTTVASEFNCISTMFRLANTPDAIIAVAEFIPEIDWPEKVPVVPLPQVCQSLHDAFKFPKGGMVHLRQGMKDQAYASAKALVHLVVQRSCVGVTDNVRPITSKLLPILRYHSEEDGDLTSTLYLIDAIINGELRPIPWEELAVSDNHLRWLGYVLRCRAWDVLQTGGDLPSDVDGFIRHSLGRNPPPQVIADCLLILDMAIGNVPIFNSKLFTRDRSLETNAALQRIYACLARELVPYSPPQDRERAVRVLELITLLEDDRARDSSYELFRSIVATVSSDEWLWNPAQLSFMGAFGWDTSLPAVGDPKAILDFLEYCLIKQESGGGLQDRPIERVFCALAFSADKAAWTQALGIVNFSQPRYLNGLCTALRRDAPYLLRRSTVLILPHLDEQLFTAGSCVLPDSGRASALVTGWSSAVGDALEKKPTDNVKTSAVTTLFGLIDSPFWRQYVPVERLTILEYASLINDELPKPFERCLRNLDILPYLTMTKGAKGMQVLWVLIQWVNCYHLSGSMRAKLESSTREVWAAARPGDPASFVSIMDKEIARLERVIRTYDTWSFEPRVTLLRANLEELLKSREELVKIRRSVT